MIDAGSFAAQVLDLLLDGTDPVLEALRSQTKSASVREIERSEFGVLIDLWVEDDVQPLDIGHRFAIDDLFGKVSGVDGEVGFQLHVIRGRIKTIEAWVSEAGWSEEPELVDSWYVAPDVDPEKAELVRVEERDCAFAVRGIEGDPEE